MPKAPVMALEDSIRRVPIEMAMQELGWTKDYTDGLVYFWTHPDHPGEQKMLSEVCYIELEKKRKALLEEIEISEGYWFAWQLTVVFWVLAIGLYVICTR